MAPNTVYTDDQMTSEEILDRLAEVSPGREADLLVEAFVILADPFCRKVASRLCYRFKLHRESYQDDFANRAREAVLMLAREVVGNPDKLDEIGSWQAIVQNRMTRSASTWIDSPEGLNHFSGTQACTRRRRDLEKTRAAMTLELGREPSDEELIEANNARMLARRSDPKRQGALADVTDLHFSERVGSTDVEGFDVVGGGDPAESETDLHPSETNRMVRMVIEACQRASDPKLGTIAGIYFSLFESEGTEPSSTQVAEHIDLKPSTVRGKVAEMKVVAAQVFRTYGIEPSA